MDIAIVGTGISGNLAARLLATRHRVTLFEAADYAGGHTNSVGVTTSSGTVTVDTGFMVFNRRTYPHFCRMLELLGVESQASDMSFSVRCDATGLEYNGTSLNTMFAQRTNLWNPKFYRLIRDILRFNRAGTDFAARAGSLDDNITLGEFLNDHQLGEGVRRHYLIPMLAAIWSAAPESVERLPARFILGFMDNHGLMQVRDRPQWRTVMGGAKQYVAKLLQPLAGCVKLGTPIHKIVRRAEGVTIYPAFGEPQQFDQVVLATHADQSLAMLDQPTAAERQVLTALPYQSNTTILHSDPTPMPTRQRAWASWNYRIPNQTTTGPRLASVTYHLNRLQNLATDDPVFVTLNPVTPIAEEHIHQTFNYHHPAYNLQSVAAQQRWGDISGQRRTWYCGAYWGYGFHEDGVRSALRVAKAFDIELDALKQHVVPQQTKATSPLSAVNH